MAEPEAPATTRTKIVSAVENHLPHFTDENGNKISWFDFTADDARQLAVRTFEQVLIDSGIEAHIKVIMQYIHDAVLNLENQIVNVHLKPEIQALTPLTKLQWEKVWACLRMRGFDIVQGWIDPTKNDPNGQVTVKWPNQTLDVS